jgi:hypothetical protein
MAAFGYAMVLIFPLLEDATPKAETKFDEGRKNGPEKR